MEYFLEYFTMNYILIAIAAVMIFTSIQTYRSNKKTSIYIILIIGIALVLSVAEILQDYFQYELRNAALCIVTSCIGYILRPVAVILFVLLSGQTFKKKISWLFFVPIAATIIIYILPLIPATYDLVFTFKRKDDGSINWWGADNPLRFTSHIASGIYLLFFIYRSISSIRAKHFAQAASIIIVSTVVVGAVVAETFFNTNGNLKLTNSAIGVSAVFYYLHIFTQQTRYDPLTHLFNRSTYYSDLRKMGPDISAVIQLDMNGLKYFNDTFGHIEGDNGLVTIASTLTKCATPKMYCYRLSGDEFTILDTGDQESKVVETIALIKAELEKTKYRVSIGYACKKDNEPVEALLRAAEIEMYKDKEEFYKHAEIDRRKIYAPTQEK